MKKTMKYACSVLISTCVMLIFCNLALSEPYAESNYFSLYQQSKTYAYTDVNNVSRSQTRVGFRYQNDRTDSIVVCGKENYSECVTAAYNSVLTLRAMYTGSISRFKVYVPPGTKSVSLLSHVGNEGDYFAIARLGTPPQLDSTYVPSSSVFSVLPNSGFTLSELRNADCVGKNSQGYLFIASDSGLSISSESEGGWLYVIVKVISGYIIDNIYSNQVNVGNPDSPGTFIEWYTQKTLRDTWGTLGEQSYIGTAPVTTPTPTPTGTTKPTPTPTPAPTPTTGCDSFACANKGGRCVNGVCVISTPTPTPTATSTPSTCNELLCMFSGGTCVNGTCVTSSPTPTPTPTATPTPTPTATPTPTPTPVSLIFDAKPLAQLNIERKKCTNINLSTMIPVLRSSILPSGNVTFYSALFVSDANPTMFFAQKDILQKEAFIYYAVGDPIKGHGSGEFPADGTWEDSAFKSLFTGLPAANCASLADTGLSFLFGYAPQGDLSQFHGAAFTFVTTP